MHLSLPRCCHLSINLDKCRLSSPQLTQLSTYLRRPRMLMSTHFRPSYGRWPRCRRHAYLRPLCQPLLGFEASVINVEYLLRIPRRLAGHHWRIVYCVHNTCGSAACLGSLCLSPFVLPLVNGMGTCRTARAQTVGNRPSQSVSNSATRILGLRSIDAGSLGPPTERNATKSHNKGLRTRSISLGASASQLFFWTLRRASSR
jgi:hypothetical protein